jgi:hypothetical protein
MIKEKIRAEIQPGMVIPKPDAKAYFKVKGWGMRRNASALIYTIPNHKIPSKPYQKGITTEEFEKAYAQLKTSGEFTREWFNRALPLCAREGGCNFTTIGGIFELLGVAKYSDRGMYAKIE